MVLLRAWFLTLISSIGKQLYTYFLFHLQTKYTHMITIHIAFTPKKKNSKQFKPILVKFIVKVICNHVASKRAVNQVSEKKTQLLPRDLTIFNQMLYEILVSLIDFKYMWLCVCVLVPAWAMSFSTNYLFTSKKNWRHSIIIIHFKKISSLFPIRFFPLTVAISICRCFFFRFGRMCIDVYVFFK